MTISDDSILEFAEACKSVAQKVDALGLALVEAVEQIANLQNRVTFLEGLTQGQQSRIENLVNRIKELERNSGHRRY